MELWNDSEFVNEFTKEYEEELYHNANQQNPSPEDLIVLDESFGDEQEQRVTNGNLPSRSISEVHFTNNRQYQATVIEDREAGRFSTVDRNKEEHSTLNRFEIRTRSFANQRYAAQRAKYTTNRSHLHATSHKRLQGTADESRSNTVKRQRKIGDSSPYELYRRRLGETRNLDKLKFLPTSQIKRSTSRIKYASLHLHSPEHYYDKTPVSCYFSESIVRKKSNASIQSHRHRFTSHTSNQKRSHLHERYISTPAKSFSDEYDDRKEFPFNHYSSFRFQSDDNRRYVEQKNFRNVSHRPKADFRCKKKHTNLMKSSSKDPVRVIDDKKYQPKHFSESQLYQFHCSRDKVNFYKSDNDSETKKYSDSKKSYLETSFRNRNEPSSSMAHYSSYLSASSANEFSPTGCYFTSRIPHSKERFLSQSPKSLELPRRDFSVSSFKKTNDFHSSIYSCSQNEINNKYSMECNVMKRKREISRAEYSKMNYTKRT